MSILSTQIKYDVTDETKFKIIKTQECSLDENTMMDINFKNGWGLLSIKFFKV